MRLPISKNEFGSMEAPRSRMTPAESADQEFFAALSSACKKFMVTAAAEQETNHSDSIEMRPAVRREFSIQTVFRKGHEVTAETRHLVALCMVASGLLLAAGCGSGSRPESESNHGPRRTDMRSAAMKPEPAISLENSIEEQSTPDELRARSLLSQLSSPGLEEDRWEKAHQELLHLGSAATKVLAQAIQTGTDIEREMAATTLALMGPETSTAAPALVAALQDPLPFVRANAAAALVQIPEYADKAIPTLISLLQSHDPQLREMATVNLAAAGPSAAGALEKLREALTAESSPDVLRPVVELLGRIGPAAQPALKDLERLAQQRPGEIGTAAETAIQLISAESAAP
jgi:hypothetical protein